MCVCLFILLCLKMTGTFQLDVGCFFGCFFLVIDIRCLMCKIVVCVCCLKLLITNYTVEVLQIVKQRKYYC